MTLVLLIVLVVLLIGVFPVWPYSANIGYYPSGIVAVLILVLALLLLTGRL